MVEYIVSVRVIVDVTPNGLVDTKALAVRKVLNALGDHVDQVYFDKVVENTIKRSDNK